MRTLRLAAPEETPEETGVDVCCGVDCSCCVFGDGSSPQDHAKNCELITKSDGCCTCGAGDA